jgi:hypothetical protein
MAGVELFALGAVALFFVASLRRVPLAALTVIGLLGLASNSGAPLPSLPGLDRIAAAKAEVTGVQDAQARRAACNASALRSLADPEGTDAGRVRDACS